jgi:signal peptidase I
MDGESQHENRLKEVFKKIGYFFLDIIQTVVMALAVFVVVYLFVFQPNQVKGSSMVGTLHDGEYLLTDKLTYRWMRQPERGDIVVFRAPENEKYDFIKRVIALPGDSVSLTEGKIYVNGNPVNEYYLAPALQTRAGAFLKNDQQYIVPEGGYMVMGDNRSYSSDSREWGPVPRENIIGRAWFRYWPLTKIGLLSHANLSE